MRVKQAAAWPLAARAQLGNRVRRIGVLMPTVETSPNPPAFTQALAGLGWTDGRNVRMDLRWSGGDVNRIRVLAPRLSLRQTLRYVIFSIHALWV